MAKKCDITVFGATGFTGERVVKELVQQKCSSIALAGRNLGKLQEVARRYGLTGKAQLIHAEVDDYTSLLDMARKSRLVLACVGPYRLYGEPVVRACVEVGTDYMDVSGEPEFMERMEATYFDAARSSGCYVVSAVGFDSVPADLGAMYSAARFSPPAVCHAVEGFLTLHTGPAGFAGHFATYQSAVLGFGSASNLSALRRQLDKQPWRGNLRGLPGPRLKRHSRAVWEPRVGAYIMPFPGSDAAVVRRTNQLLVSRGGLADATAASPAAVAAPVAAGSGTAAVRSAAAAACGGSAAGASELLPPGREGDAYRPIQHAAYFTLPGAAAVVQFLVFGAAFALLAGFSWGRSLLLRYPQFFSRGLFSYEGPTQQQLDQTSFSMTFLAHGYSKGAPSNGSTDTQPPPLPDVHKLCRVSGPEPGYVATPALLVTAALTLLDNRPALGPGGVYTPGYLLRHTDVVSRLKKRGITFEELAGPAAAGLLELAASNAAGLWG